MLECVVFFEDVEKSSPSLNIQRGTKCFLVSKASIRPCLSPVITFFLQLNYLSCSKLSKMTMHFTLPPSTSLDGNKGVKSVIWPLWGGLRIFFPSWQGTGLTQPIYEFYPQLFWTQNFPILAGYRVDLANFTHLSRHSTQIDFFFNLEFFPHLGRVRPGYTLTQNVFPILAGYTLTQPILPQQAQYLD